MTASLRSSSNSPRGLIRKLRASTIDDWEDPHFLQDSIDHLDDELSLLLYSISPEITGTLDFYFMHIPTYFLIGLHRFSSLTALFNDAVASSEINCCSLLLLTTIGSLKDGN